MNKNLTAYFLERQESSLSEIQKTVEIMRHFHGDVWDLAESLEYLASATETLAYVIENLIKYGDTND